MTTDNTPKYACRLCGSNEIRGEFDSYPVFQAEGDRLVFLRMDSIPGGLSELYCNFCHESIDVEYEKLGDIEVI